MILAQVQALKKNFPKRVLVGAVHSASWRYGGRWLVEVFSFYFLNSHENTSFASCEWPNLVFQITSSWVQKVSFLQFQKSNFFSICLRKLNYFFYFVWSEINLQTNKSTETQVRTRFFYFIYNLWRFASW